MTGRPAVTAAATRISTVVTSGVRTTNAAGPLASMAPATGSQSELHMTLTVPLVDGRASIHDLEVRAEQCRQPVLMRQWVRSLFAPTERKRLNRKARTLLIDGRIGVWELYNFAADWDLMGLTCPSEFVEAMSCETRGHPRGDVVLALLSVDSGLKSETSETPDEWATWRYGK